MHDREPTVRSRELGESLRRVMEHAGYNGTTIAQRLGWSQGHVSRLLSGKRGGSILDVSAFLAVCAVTGAERDRLLTLTPQNTEPGWFLPHGARRPTRPATLIHHEHRASTISQFEPTLIPDLLQTRDYARATLLEAGTIPTSEIDDQVEARRRRQDLFGWFTPPRFVFYIHEFALRLRVGGPEVMSKQLHHLLRMSVHPTVSVRIVPATRGAHAAIHGPFRLLEFKNAHPVAYLETETASVFLELSSETEAYQAILAKLATTALPVGPSRELIARIATELCSAQPTV
jgi:transcriptional regulator with XRE-family HTH domain